MTTLCPVATKRGSYDVGKKMAVEARVAFDTHILVLARSVIELMGRKAYKKASDEYGRSITKN